MCFPDRRRHLRMSVPITFRDQPEHECRDDEYRYSSLNGSEAKSLPHFVKFEAAIFNQGTNSWKCVWLKTVASLNSCLVRCYLRQARLTRSAALRSDPGWLRDRPDTTRSRCRSRSRQGGRQSPSRTERSVHLQPNREQIAADDAENDPENSAGFRDENGLGQELTQNVATPRAD